MCLSLSHQQRQDSNFVFSLWICTIYYTRILETSKGLWQKKVDAVQIVAVFIFLSNFKMPSCLHVIFYEWNYCCFVRFYPLHKSTKYLQSALFLSTYPPLHTLTIPHTRWPNWNYISATIACYWFCSHNMKIRYRRSIVLLSNSPYQWQKKRGEYVLLFCAGKQRRSK